MIHCSIFVLTSSYWRSWRVLVSMPPCLQLFLPFSMVVDDTLDAHHRSMTKATRYEAQKRHYLQNKICSASATSSTTLYKTIVHLRVNIRVLSPSLVWLRVDLPRKTSNGFWEPRFLSGMLLCIYTANSNVHLIGAYLELYCRLAVQVTKWVFEICRYRYVHTAGYQSTNVVMIRMNMKFMNR